MTDTAAQDEKRQMPKHPEVVRITLDGRKLTLDDETQTAAAILRLGGLDPAGYDLAQVHHGRDPQTFGDNEVLELENGDAFVSIRQSAQVG